MQSGTIGGSVRLCIQIGVDDHERIKRRSRLLGPASIDGLTLIEVLVACVILMLTVYIAARLFVGANHAVDDSGCRIVAINLCRAQAELVRRTPYDRLVPRIVSVPVTPDLGADGSSHCTVSLGHEHLVPTTIRVYRAGQPVPADDYIVDCEHGILRLPTSYAGIRLTVDYSHIIKDKSESIVVPNEPPFKVRLVDYPITRIDSIVSDGNEIHPSAIDQETGYILFGPADAGRKVAVDYQSNGVVTVISGKYVREDLSTSETDTGAKEITVETRWNSNRRDKHMVLTCIRTR